MKQNLQFQNIENNDIKKIQELISLGENKITQEEFVNNCSSNVFLSDILVPKL